LYKHLKLSILQQRVIGFMALLRRHLLSCRAMFIGVLLC